MKNDHFTIKRSKTVIYSDILLFGCEYEGRRSTIFYKCI